MKVKKDSINLVNKKKNPLSSTAQLLNLKNNKFKTRPYTKSDIQNSKKTQFVKEKLNLALGLEGKPKQKQTLSSNNQFTVGQPRSNFKSKKLSNQAKAPGSLQSHAEKPKTAKRYVSPLASQSKLMKENTPSKNQEGANSSTAKGKLSFKQLEKNEIPRKLSKRKGWNHSGKNAIKKKKTKPMSTPLNLVGEEKLDLQKVTTVVNGLYKLIKSNTSPHLLGLEEPIFMEVECIKIPQCPTKQLRFKLPHPLVNDLSDILLITTDLKGHKPDTEGSVEHYTQLLKQHNITFIQKVMPLRLLRQECSQFEVRNKLVNQFDMILVEASAAKSVPKLLGKYALFNKMMPIPVHLDRKDLKNHLQIAISKTQMTVKPKGHMSSVQVGHTKMSASEIAENIVEISKTLPFDYPGGWANIRSLQIKASDSVPLLVYVSFMSPNMVRLKAEQSRSHREVEGELSTYPDRTVVVRSDGTVFIKIADKDVRSDDVSDSGDDEILKEAENYVQSSRTIRHDDDSDDEEDAEAMTKAAEKELLSKYEKSAAKKRSIEDEEAEDEEEEEGESSEEEEAALPPTGKKQKLEATKKGPKGSAQGSKYKGNRQQQHFKGKQNREAGQIQKRGSRGGKKNKINKGERKAQLKREKASKK